MNRFILWIAQGFGSGRAPFAPGTFGSVVGLGWFLALLSLGNLIGFTVALLASFVASVWFCGKAEKILNAKDPGSVVLDEIVAIPLCFVSWMAIRFWGQGQSPFVPQYFFTGRGVALAAAGFALFRLFDIAKPWPVRQSQKLPGGWGITVDDLLAAVYVDFVILIVWWIRPQWF